MNRDETVSLLKLVVAGDRRTIGPEDVQYWHAMLGPIALTDAITALVMFRRREPGKWIDPGHLWQMCASRTDGDAAEHGITSRCTCDQAGTCPVCTHGVICDTCKLVHRPDEPCDVLVPAEWPRALGTVTRTPPAVDTPSPDPDTAGVDDDTEAERARQAAALAALAQAETVEAAQ